ncbi:MAG: two-component system, chemotaxis family, response regulator WspR [Bryobacterales bacterium]|jgi:hypothetical protein|nr:two-component system, chemotaxis family, response regulator WspR [Bryobacterales bacterium]
MKGATQSLRNPEASEGMTFGKQVVSKLLDAYPAQVALIDEAGTILVVNRAWKEFGLRNGLADPKSCEGSNYLEECERARARGVPRAGSIAKGILSVLRGEAASAGYSYPSHSPTERRWFRLIVAPFSPSSETRWAVLFHVNTTPQRKLAMRYARLHKRHVDFVTVCAWCKLIENGPDSWTTFEEYFSANNGIRFSHGICHTCMNAFLKGSSF